MSKKSTYVSIGREIEQGRMTKSSGFSDILNEKELRNRATSLLQKPQLKKFYKNKKDGAIIKPNKIAEQLRNTFIDKLNLSNLECAAPPKSAVSHQSSTTTQPLCFEIDFDWLDYCDEQKFKQIFKEDLKDIPDIEQYVEDNQSYLCHIFAQCACAKCTCNKCICQYKKKLELNYAYGMLTSNRFDYVPKQNKCFTPIITQSHYDNIALPVASMQFNSTQRDNYKWIPQDRPRTAAKSMYESHNLPTGQTTNNVRIIIQQSCSHLSIGRTILPIYLRLHNFELLTNYRNQFIWKIKDENQPTAEDVKQKQFHQTITKIYPNQLRSIYQESFVQKNQKPLRVFMKPEELIPCSAYQGQYITTKQMDYEGKQISTKEIQQKPWKGRLIKKLQNIQ
ncbi:unnamed protein product [Paramecium primaurelia]|uniref:Uncharacterized protein n=1 Tax=Paramecium primaurelia TaxID=5886 RepID=A0A8S1Q5E2_PARPR|nr:unnamed protein product [Paramecium primaurelia]